MLMWIPAFAGMTKWGWNVFEENELFSVLNEIPDHLFIFPSEEWNAGDDKRKCLVFY